MQRDEYGAPNLPSGSASLEVTIVTVDQIVWFTGSEVAACLEYANPQKTLRHHMDEEGREIQEDLYGAYGRDEIAHSV